jgi:hypothetical protein
MTQWHTTFHLPAINTLSVGEVVLQIFNTPRPTRHLSTRCLQLSSLGRSQRLERRVALSKSCLSCSGKARMKNHCEVQLETSSHERVVPARLMERRSIS